MANETTSEWTTIEAYEAHLDAGCTGLETKAERAAISRRGVKLGRAARAAAIALLGLDAEEPGNPYVGTTRELIAAARAKVAA